MWARVDCCSAVLFDGFQTTKARDHMALFVFTEILLQMSKLLNQLRAERLQAETQINELRQMAKKSPISRTVSLIEINRRISELEEFLLHIEEYLPQAEKTEAQFEEFFEKIKGQ